MNFLTDNEIDSMLASKPNDIFNTFKISFWLASHYFVKCANCGYEVFVGENHTAPIECHACGCKMIKVVKED